MAYAHDITLRAAYDVTQLSSARVAVQCDMCQRKIHSRAQGATHAAESCNVIQLMDTLPAILLNMMYDATEHIRWQVYNRHAWCCLTCHADFASSKLVTAPSGSRHVNLCKCTLPGEARTEFGPNPQS
jgi:hypothetical protein